MDLLLKKVQKKHLPLIAELAKRLKIEIGEPVEDDAYYLSAMEAGEKTGLLSEEEKLTFITSLRTR